MTEAEKQLVDKIHASNYRMLDELDRMCKKFDIQYFLAYGGLLGAVRHGDFIPWDDDVDVIMYPGEMQKLYEHREELAAEYRLVMPEDYGDKYYDMVPRINDTTLPILQEDSKVLEFYGKGLRDYAALDIFLLAGVPEGIRGWIYKLKLQVIYGMAGAHRCPTLSGVNKGILYFGRRILELGGKLFSARQIRNRCEKLLMRYASSNLPYVVVANGDRNDLKCKMKAEWFSSTVTLAMKEHSYEAPAQYKKVLEACYGDYMILPPPEQQHPHSIQK